MAAHSHEAVTLVNQMFLNISEQADSPIQLGERLRQEAAETDSIVYDLQAELERRQREVQALTIPQIPPPMQQEPVNIALNHLIKIVRPLTQDLSNLETAFFFQQIFGDFMLCQAFNIRMMADFDNIDPGFPPVFRYGLANPFERAQFLHVLKMLLVFKPVKHAALPGQPYPDVPPPYGLLRLLFKEKGKIPDISILHNEAVSFINKQYDMLQEIDLHDTNDVLEEQLDLLVAISNGETCFSQPCVAKKFEFTGEFWKLATYLNAEEPNFPMAAQVFECLKAIGGESWKERHLYFFCIFEAQFADVQFDYQPVHLPPVADRDSYNQALNIVKTQIPELVNYFNVVRDKIFGMCLLIDAVCPDGEMLKELLEFANQLLVNKFLTLFVSPSCVSNLQYFKALFMELINDIRSHKLERLRLKYQNTKFGYQKFAPNSSICHQKTFLDEFATELERPEIENFFMRKIKMKLRLRTLENAETINLEDDICYQLGEFAPNKTYTDFGLVSLKYDFVNYITNHILAQPRELVEETRRAELDRLRQKKVLTARASSVIVNARTDFQQRMRKMIAEIDELQAKGAKAPKDVTEATIREKYRPIPPSIASSIQDSISEIKEFLERAANSPHSTPKALEKPEFEGPNCVLRRMLPKIPPTLLLVADYNSLDGDRVMFDQQLLTKYYQQLKEFKFEPSQFYAAMSEKELSTLRFPWKWFIRDPEEMQLRRNELNAREEQEFVSIDACEFDDILESICSKLFKKQVTLEEASLQMNPLMEQSLPFNYQFNEALMHISEYIVNETSAKIVIDPLPMGTAFKAAMQRLFILANSKFSAQLVSSTILSGSAVQQIVRICVLYFDEMGQKMEQSSECLIRSCRTALGPYYADSEARQTFPEVPPLSTPTNLLTDTKALKYYEQYVSVNLKESIPLPRSKEDVLCDGLRKLGLTEFGEPLGFCPHGTPQQFLYAYLAAPYSPTCGVQIPLLDLLQRACHANVYLIKHLTGLLQVFQFDLQLSEAIEAQMLHLFERIESSVEKLMEYEMEMLIASIKVVWSEVGSGAYNFASEERLSGALTQIPDCSQKAPLLSDSTPAHSALIIAILDKLEGINNLQGAAFFARFVREFTTALLEHATRLAFSRFEDGLLLKAEINAYERKFRLMAQKCDFVCATEAPEVLTEIREHLQEFERLKETLSGKVPDGQRASVYSLIHQRVTKEELFQ